MSRPALLLYCQHSLGLGHLKRSWVLAEALLADFSVVVLSGGEPPHGLCPPRGVDIVQLTPLSQDTGGHLHCLDGSMSVHEAQARRKAAIMRALHATRPAVVLVELFPFGRRKFAGELLPLIEEARRPPRALVLSSVRDILVNLNVNQQARDDKARQIADEYFDGVLVHADPQFAVFEESFRPTEPLRVPVHYTGFVVAPGEIVREPPFPPRVLVSAGGGRYGGPLFNAALDAYVRLAGRPDVTMTIVTGPLCPSETLDGLHRAAAGLAGLTIERTVPDLALEMARATLSVSQCGYNTALDIIKSGVAALVVPFSDAGENEQSNRASRLQGLGALRVLEAERLDGATLASAIEETLSFRPQGVSLDLTGAATTARLIATLLRRSRTRASGRSATRRLDRSTTQHAYPVRKSSLPPRTH
jgi:predicted glycosyltransferase